MNRKLVSRLAVVAITAATACAWGDYAYPLYTVTVDEGVTNSLDAAEVQVISEEGGEAETVAFPTLSGNITDGTFRKRGRGFLQGSTGMAEFAGDFLIEEGAYIVTTNRQTGKCLATTDTSTRYKEAEYFAGTAHLVISNGASLVIDTVTVLHLTQRLTFGGEGLDGMGAICNETKPITDALLLNTIFYNAYVTMTDDALMCNRTTQRFGFGYGYFNMNGHTFTLRDLNGRAQQVICGVHFRTPGHLVFDGAEAYISSSRSWDGDASNTITFTNNARCRFYAVTSAAYYWTLDVRQDALTMISDSGGENFWTRTNRGCWRGPILLNGAVTVDCAADDALNLYGPISGTNGITIYRRWLRLHNPANTFEGGLTVNANGHAIIHADGAVPVNGGPITVASGGELGFGDRSAAYNLPAVDWTVKSGASVAFEGSASGTLAALTKKGAGRLTVESGMSVTGRTELAEGTLALTPLRYSDAPGLDEKVVGYDQTAFTAKYNSNTKKDAAYKAFIDNGTFPDVADTYKDISSVQPSPQYCNLVGRPSWSNYQFAAYSGYIWNRSPTNETWAFALSVTHRGRIAIDGQTVCESVPVGTGMPTYRSGVWWFLRTNSVEVAPGPHLFEARAFNFEYKTAGATAATAVWDEDLFRAQTNNNVKVVPTWTTGHGVVFNRTGNRTIDVDDYEIPSNGFTSAFEGGDGYLFTRTDKEPDGTCTLFSNIVAATGTTLDVGLYKALEVPRFEGVTTVTNGDLAISGAWVLAAETAAAGNCLKVHGALSFGANAAIEISQTAGRIPPSEGGWMIAEAEDGISLPSDWRSRVVFPDGKYRLSLSEDGKRLVLEHFNGTVLSLR